MTNPKLRDKDHLILKKISEGLNDTQKIKAETTLQNHEIRYSLKKLETQGLITLKKPDGMVERVINGQKRVFQHPLQAQTTQKGLNHLKKSDEKDIEAYENMSHRDLVERTRAIEKKTNELEKKFNIFKRQVSTKLNQSQKDN